MKSGPVEFWIFFTAVFSVILYFNLKIRKVACKNFEILAKLLVSPEIHADLFRFKVTGFYNGRKVELRYGGGETTAVYFSIEPNRELKARIFLVKYFRPTESTVLKGKKIYYSNSGLIDQIYEGAFTESQFSEVLKDLSQAAEIVEKDPQIH